MTAEITTPALFGLRGKVAILTGGNGGIGLGMARGLAAVGADIAVIGRSETKSGRRSRRAHPGRLPGHLLPCRRHR